MQRSEAIQLVQNIRNVAELALVEGSPIVRIVVQKESAPTSERIHLAGHGGPVGDVCEIKPTGSAWIVTAKFRCAAVILWANKSIQRLSGAA